MNEHYNLDAPDAIAGHNTFMFLFVTLERQSVFTHSVTCHVGGRIFRTSVAFFHCLQLNTLKIYKYSR